MKIIYLSSIILFVAFISNCVSHQGRIDDQQFWKDKDLESAYKEALQTKSSSCSVFVSLSRHSDFLLSEEALFHALQNCSLDQLRELNLTGIEKKHLEDFFKFETLTNYSKYIRLAEKDRSYLNTNKLITGDPADTEATSRTDQKIETEKESLSLAEIEKLSEFFSEKSDRLNFYKNFIGFCQTDEYCSSEVRNKIYNINPIEDPELATKFPISYADQLRDIRNYNKAIQIYKNELSKEKNPEIKSKIYKKIIFTYKLQGRRDLMLKMANEFYKQSKLGYLKNKKSEVYKSIYIDATTTVARRFWTENEVDRGQQMLHEADGFLTQDKDEILFILAKIAESQNFKTQALYNYSLLLNHINEKSPELIINLTSDIKTPLEERILDTLKKYKTLNTTHTKYFWSLAWFFIKSEKWESAHSVLNNLTQSTLESSDLYKFKFWLGYCHEKLGQTNEAEANYSYVLERDILGYYGVISSYKLKKSLPGMLNQNKKIFDSNWPIEIKKLSLLAYVNDKTLFPIYLNSLRKKFTQSEYNYLFQVLNAFNGHYLPLFAYISQSGFEEKQNILNSNTALVYPIDYFEQVEKESTQQKFSKEFVLSIIRQESAFNPRARSGSDALGLMQLIPSTAKKNIKRLQLNLNFKPEDLYQPELNIKLGISELKSLYDKSNNSYIFAAAAYNAGEAPVKKWLKERFSNDPLIFIEDIPYEETRTYVKLAIRNFTFYQRILNQTEYLLTEDILKISQN